MGTAGIAVCATSPAQAGFINGSFEAPYGADHVQQCAGLANHLLGFASLTDGPVYAYQGRQFAEINANGAATLYQDVSGISAGSIVGFEFAHRGRSGVDTMRLTITDLGINSVLFVKDYSTGNTAWGFYTSVLEAPIVALGHTIRFAYEARSTASGNSTVGNFIDAANFGVGVAVQRVPEPAALALMGLGLIGLGLSRRRK